MLDTRTPKPYQLKNGAPSSGTPPERNIPPLRRFRRWCFYGVVRVLVAGIRRSPRAFGRTLLRSLAELAWRTRRGERATALRQLEIAFPGLSEAERRATGRAALVHLAEALTDSVRSDRGVWMSGGEEAVLRELAGAETPLLILTAHLGAWELLGRWLAQRCAPLAVITADPHNARVNAWLRGERQRWGLVSFDRRAQRWSAARWIRVGRNLAILADHRSSVAKVEAPWFGRDAATVIGPGRLARWSGAEVLAVGIRRDPAGHRAYIGRRFRWEEDDDERRFATRCNEALEDLIRQAPSEWTWWHGRHDPAPVAPSGVRRS